MTGLGIRYKDFNADGTYYLAEGKGSDLQAAVFDILSNLQALSVRIPAEFYQQIVVCNDNRGLELKFSSKNGEYSMIIMSVFIR